MPRPHARPSIRDVAALAGVSYQTVSRVLNGSEAVKPETAQRVYDAIGQLKYRPSRAARSLARNRSDLIGVISVQGTLYGPGQMVLAIDEGARARDFATVVVSVRDDTPAGLHDAREHLLSLGVEGVVVIAWSEAVLDLTQRFARDLPTAVVAEGPVPDGTPRATANHRLGGALATGALLARGRTRVGHLAGPGEWLEARAREAGWRAAAQEHAAAVVAAGWTPAGGYRAMGELLAMSPDLDAVFAANDNLAIGALQRLSEMGRAVPGEVALVGYDDLEVAPYLSVPLASIRQPFSEVGSAAVELLFAAMGGDAPEERVLDPHLVSRTSLG